MRKPKHGHRTKMASPDCRRQSAGQRLIAQEAIEIGRNLGNADRMALGRDAAMKIGERLRIVRGARSRAGPTRGDRSPDRFPGRTAGGDPDSLFSFAAQIAAGRQSRRPGRRLAPDFRSIGRRGRMRFPLFFDRTPFLASGRSRNRPSRRGDTFRRAAGTSRLDAAHSQNAARRGVTGSSHATPAAPSESGTPLLIDQPGHRIGKFDRGYSRGRDARGIKEESPARAESASEHY